MPVTTGAVVTAAAVSGGLGLASNLASSAIAADAQEDANYNNWQHHLYDLNWQEKMQAQTQLYNSTEAERARQFQRQMYDLQWQDMQQYNDPQAQYERWRSTGLDPSQMIGASTSGILSPPSLSNTPAPQVSSPTPNQSPFQSVPVSSQAEMISAVGGFLKNLSELPKNIGDGAVATGAADSMILLQQYNVLEASQRAKFNEIGLIYADSKHKAEIDKIVAETMTEFSKQMLNGELTNTEKFNQAWKAAMANFYDAKAFMTEAQWQTIMLQMPYVEMTASLQCQLQQKMIGLTAAQTRYYGAAAGNQSAQAGYYRALESTDNVLRGYRVTAADLQNIGTEFQNQILGVDSFVALNTQKERLSAVVAQYHREGLINDQMAEEWKQMCIKTKWAERQEFANYVATFFNCANGAISNVVSARGQSLQYMSRMDRNRIAEKAADAYSRSVDSKILKDDPYNGYGQPFDAPWHPESEWYRGQ